MLDYIRNLSLEGKITILILLATIVILIIFNLYKKTQVDIREEALNSAGIYPLDVYNSIESSEKFNNSKYYSLETIVNDIDNYLKLYFPLLDIHSINYILRTLGYNTIKQQFKSNKNNKAVIDKFDLESFIEIYSHLIYNEDDKHKQKTYFDLATIASISFLNTKENNKPFNIDYQGNTKSVTNVMYKYNPDFKTSGQLNIYMTTEYNEPSIKSYSNELSKDSPKCIFDYSCYVNSKKYIDIIIGDNDKQTRIKEIKNNYKDIKFCVELLFSAYIIYINDTTDKSLNHCINLVFNKVRYKKYKSTLYNYINTPSTKIHEIYLIEAVLAVSDIKSRTNVSPTSTSTQPPTTQAETTTATPTTQAETTTATPTTAPEKFEETVSTSVPTTIQNRLMYDSLDKIINNFNSYCKIFLPKLKLSDINFRLKLYGFGKDETIDKIFSANINNSKIYDYLSIIYQLYSLYCISNNYTTWFKVAFIGFLSLIFIKIKQTVNLKEPLNQINLKYNSNSLNKTDRLKLFINTNLNSSILLSNAIEIDMLNEFQSDCIDKQLCYYTPNRFEENLIEKYNINSSLLTNHKDKLYSALIFIIIDIAFELQNNTRPAKFISDFNLVIPGFDINIFKK